MMFWKHCNYPRHFYRLHLDENNELMIYIGYCSAKYSIIQVRTMNSWCSDQCRQKKNHLRSLYWRYVYLSSNILRKWYTGMPLGGISAECTKFDGKICASSVGDKLAWQYGNQPLALWGKGNKRVSQKMSLQFHSNMAGDWRWPAGQLTSVRRPATWYNEITLLTKKRNIRLNYR